MAEIESQTGTGELSRAELVAAVKEATLHVFSTMLGLEAEAGESILKKPATAEASAVVSLVGLAGTWAGAGSMSCSAAFACKLSSRLLAAECDAVTEEVLDSVAELINMIVGNVKTAVEERLGPMWLSTPTVIFGRNLQTRSAGNQDWIVVPFRIGDDTMYVQICLSRSRDTSYREFRPGFLIPNMVHL